MAGDAPATGPVGRQEVEPPDGGGPAGARPAYYAARPGAWRDWWTLLHPPYTAWHLAYVVIGATLATHVDVKRLVATLLAFFLAVGVAAHALDELHDRPLRTAIPSPILVVASSVALAGAIALGVAGAVRVGWGLVPFLVIGPLVVIAYNFELFGGMFHSDVMFAAAWGSFPVLTGYAAQTDRVGAAPIVVAIAAFAFSLAQRRLSTPARLLRRRVAAVEGSVTLADGGSCPLDARVLLDPLEQALRALSWTAVLLAAGLAIARMT